MEVADYSLLPFYETSYYDKKNEDTAKNDHNSQKKIIRF